MPEIAGIMPCRGRSAQTVRNAQRLLATAGHADWELICVCDDDVATAQALEQSALSVRVLTAPRGGYWRALQRATAASDAPLLAMLANDLLGGQDWLARGLAAYRARFGAGDGLMGFNDGIHGPALATHFLISRGLLARYGGWPVWYHHNCGDRELSERAQHDGCYGKAPWAVLYHDHWLLGAPHDEVYAANSATLARDRELFAARKAAGWPPVVTE